MLTERNSFCLCRRDFVLSLNAYDDAERKATLQTLRALTPPLLAVVSGSEIGVEVCDWLSEQLGLPSNGSAMSEQRRDKAAMQDAIRAAGLRSIEHKRATCWEDVAAFIDWQARPTLILKPARSAGSDCIFKVTDEASARVACEHILHGVSLNQLDERNESLVVQEFLSGPEFIVDTVSRNGVHKVVAIWAYDKRSVVNEADGKQHDFVYFGQSAVSGLIGEGKALSSYAVQVLEAMGVKHGAGHAEIILTATGPCLVEVGCRPQGNEGE
jgi:biotin carboxylase